MSNKANVFFHCHTEHSLKDSPLKIKTLVNTAKAMGARAVTLTDHGTATGWVEFLNACEATKDEKGEGGVKPILGVEAYVESKYTKRSHLILIAKNYAGMQEISRAISDSNKNLQNAGGVMVPVMTKELLEANFGNGNVIATTACVSGVIATILLGTAETELNIGKLKRSLTKWDDPNGPKYKTVLGKFNEASQTVAELTTERNILDTLSSKKYTARKKGLEALKKTAISGADIAQVVEAETLLQAEMKESEDAKEKLPKVKAELAKAKKHLTLITQEKKKLEDTHENYSKTSEEINKLTASIPSWDQLYAEAKEELEWYKALFDKDLYVELQYHGMEDEKFVMQQMLKLSEELDIPMLAANDVHIATKEQAYARAFMKALRFEKWEEPTKEDLELYMKSDAELTLSLEQILPKEIVKKAIENTATVCDLCNIVIPNEDHYPKYRDENGNEVEDTGALLRKICYDNIPRCYPDGFDAYDRLEYELDTIISLGYADYTLIVADYINFAKEYGINNHPTKIALPVGPGRGSGAGSVANFLSGITNLDPLKYDLKFERYLNKDRVSMPDIDTDFSEEVREATIDYVTRKYGEETVAAIRTCMTQGAKGSIQNSARIRGYELFPNNNEESKEETKAKRHPLQVLGDSIKKEIPSQVGTNLKDCISDLRAKFTSDDAKVIIDRAEMVEGTITNLSVHAAGIIIGDGKPLKNYIPLLYNTEKKCMAVQCDMVEAEQMHLLKMDFLGLINLDIITECARRVKQNTGKTLDLNNLPFEKEVFEEIYSKGNTSCVFQFESGGMKQMLKEFQPESFEDIILLVAAYRPGPMDFIPDIIDVKHQRKKPYYVVPQLKDILSKTYGQPIYQEQLMDIFHQCAGFSLGEADIIRRYMSKKKVDKFLAYKPQFVNGIISSGATEEEANQLWDSLEGFARYAFNKSHAAAYALVSYITAWLKYHYPVEFMCATLNHTKDSKKIPGVLYECKRMGIPVCTPNVNKSLQGFEDRGDKILYGLGAISGIKKEAEIVIEERLTNGPFASLKDFLIRVPKMTKNTEKMIDCGVFDDISRFSRASLKQHLNVLTELLDKITKKEKQILELQQELSETTDFKEKSSLEKRLQNATCALETQKAQLNNVSLLNEYEDDETEKLQAEFELMGTYVSGHPLDSYSSLYKSKDIIMIDDFCEGFGYYAGMISNIRYTSRKSDGAKMAFFTLEDPTGELSVACFADAFKKNEELIQEGKVVKIYGKGIEKDGYQDSQEKEKELIVKNIFLCRKEKRPIFISVGNLEEYEDFTLPQLLEFEDDNGHPVYLHDRSTGNITQAQIYLSYDVTEALLEGVTVVPLYKH